MKTNGKIEHHHMEVSLPPDLLGWDTPKNKTNVELIPPWEDYVPFPTTTLHGRPQQGLDGEGGIEPEYGDGEYYLEDTIH